MSLLSWAFGPIFRKPEQKKSLKPLNLGKFHSLLDDTRRTSNFPRPRSGHRCYCDDNFFYVVGGYSSEHGGAIFKEIWSLNLATMQWRRYKTIGNFPDKLASFSLAQVEPFSKDVVIFGGSGSLFGLSSTNSAYHLKIDNKLNCVFVNKLETEGDLPSKKYGCAMTYGGSPKKFYVIGGTEGIIFNMDVHEIQFEKSSNQEEFQIEGRVKWKWTHLNRDKAQPEGRYRLEIAHDEKSGNILCFGGGRQDVVISLDEIDVFDTALREFKKLQTKPDIHGNFPPRRRSHSITKVNREIIIVGGVTRYSHVEDDGAEEILGDIWIYNLDSNTWRRHPHDLVQAVFFHDAAITRDGCLMVFGGLKDLNAQNRVNTLQSAYLWPPSLKRVAVDAIRQYSPKTFQGIFGNFEYDTLCSELYMRIYDEEYRRNRIEEIARNSCDTNTREINGVLWYDNGNPFHYYTRHSRVFVRDFNEFDDPENGIPRMRVREVDLQFPNLDYDSDYELDDEEMVLED